MAAVLSCFIHYALCVVVGGTGIDVMVVGVDDRCQYISCTLKGNFCRLHIRFGRSPKSVWKVSVLPGRCQ